MIDSTATYDSNFLFVGVGIRLVSPSSCPRDRIGRNGKPGGVPWTEYAKSVVDLPRCRSISSARLPARAVAPHMKKARLMNGRLTRHARQAARVARSAVEAAGAL